MTPDPSWPEPVATPATSDDAVQNLRHTLALFADSEDSQTVLTATSNVYGRNVRTGLTFADLRLIAERLGVSI